MSATIIILPMVRMEHFHDENGVAVERVTIELLPPVHRRLQAVAQSWGISTEEAAGAILTQRLQRKPRCSR